jgi:hypothetical protein
MIHRIHILGASGSGITTLGRALAERLQCPHFDTDDYFWVPTDPPYTHQREGTERQQLLMDDLTAHDAWVLSGSLCGWGDVAIPLFELNASKEIMRHRRVLGPLLSDPQMDSQSAVARGWDADAGSQSAPGYPPAGRQRLSADDYG